MRKALRIRDGVLAMIRLSGVAVFLLSAQPLLRAQTPAGQPAPEAGSSAETAAGEALDGQPAGNRSLENKRADSESGAGGALGDKPAEHEPVAGVTPPPVSGGALPASEMPTSDPAVISAGFTRLLGAVVRIDVWETSFDDGIRTTRRGFGSGAIVNEEGYILTNAHVVSPYVERIMVTLNSLERVPASLVGWDHWTDLAVIRLDMEEMQSRNLHFNPAVFGDSTQLQPGQTVYAVGTPNGLSRTVTRGIISNTTRYFEGRTVGNGYETGYFNTWLQTDAAINPGNSGGPLALPDGGIIGINTRAYLGANNLAFAVPSSIAQEVLHRLINKGQVERSYIGVLLGAMQDLENFFHLKVNQGVLVQSVDPDSPADRAGLRPGDILMAIDGRAVDGRFPEQLPAIQRQIASAAVGDSVRLELSRSGKPLELSVTTEPLQSRVGQMQAFAQWGMSVQKISLAVAREEQLRSADGVRVMGIQSGFPASEAGLERGDIIVAINSEPLHDIAQLEQIYEHYQKIPQRVLLEVTRNRQAIYLVLRPR